MSAEFSDIVALLEQLVTDSAERKRYQANPQQYLADKGIHKFSPARQVSTVITLDIEGKIPKKGGKKQLDINKVCLSTESDVLLVEVSEEFKNSCEVLDESWLNYTEDRLSFVVFVRFTKAIPENPDYHPVLRIAYNNQEGEQGQPFNGGLSIEAKRYILVKKYCSFYAQIKEANYDPTTDTLSIDFAQNGDPGPNQCGCHKQIPLAHQTD